MTEFSWPVAIVALYDWKQRAWDLDPKKVVPMTIPKLAAKPQEIEEAEKAVGFEFPNDYRAFLRHANGWKHILIDVALFGTPDFISGRAMDVLDRPGVVAALADIGLHRGQYVSIGAAEPTAEPDVYVLVRPDAGILPGGVFWFDPVRGENESFPSFEEFFLTLIEYNEFYAQHVASKTRS